MFGESQSDEERELWAEVEKSHGQSRARALMHLSYLKHHENKFEECLAICESARDIYESLPEPDRQELAHAYTGITYSLNELDRNNEAEEVGKRVIELLKEIDSPDLIRAYRDEAKFAYDAGLYEESIYYLGEVEKCLSVDEHELAIAWDKFGLSRSLIKLKRYEEAISNLKLARETFKKNRELMYVAYCDEEISLCYARTERAFLAKTHAQLALDFATLADDDVRKFWSSIRYAKACFVAAEYENALGYYLLSKEMAVSKVKQVNWVQVLKIEMQIAKCFGYLGNEKKRIESERIIQTLSDAMVLEEDENY